MRIYLSLLIGILTCLTINADNEALSGAGTRGGYQLPDIRRAGYENEPKSYLNYNGYHNGPDQTAHFQTQFGGYPQYYEAPEPIIEIIIKDANETAPQAVALPVVTKKKKEKVHVFYVNYKKDKDNKLHLEAPIASLSNDDNDDEQDEVIDYPVPVTVSPLQKSTTLRTIIHPDSEKYHSNSNIHVTFGTDAKTGHEEINSESLQHEVIALPANKANRILRPQFGTQASAENGNLQKSATNNFYEFQQLPAVQNSQPNRDFSHGTNKNYHAGSSQMQVQHIHQQKQAQQQHNQKLKVQQHFQHHQNIPTNQHFDSNFPSLEELHKHAQYFVSHNQQYTAPQQHQQYPKQQQDRNNQITFPTQQKPANPLNTYQPNQQQYQQFHQHNQKQNIMFHKQPQFVQQPHFVATSPPQQKEYVNYAAAQQHNYSPKPQLQITTPQPATVNKHPQNFVTPNFQQLFNNRHQGVQNSYQPTTDKQPAQRLHNFKIQPQNTELLKSISKYEHHITETIPSSSNKNPYQPLGSAVLHDIPAPNLAKQNTQPNVIVNYNSAPASHQRDYNTASTLNAQQFAGSTVAPVYDQTPDGKQVMIVTPMPLTYTHKQLNEANKQSNSDLRNFYYSTPNSNSNYQTPTIKQVESLPRNAKLESTTTTSLIDKNKYNQLQAQLPEEVPDDLREQLLSSGILENAQISVLDYDKTGDISLENLPKEHLEHFYNAGPGQQQSESQRVVSVVNPNAGKVSQNEKKIENLNLKVNINKNNEPVTKKHMKSDVLNNPTIEINEEGQYHRYLPLKINGSQFPLPESDVLKGKKIVSVVVLTPVTNKQNFLSESRSKDDQTNKRKIADDLLKSLVKKPTTENFKHWLEKESKSDLESQSIILLVAKSSERDGQEIFLFDNGTGDINKLNGEFSSAFVNIAEENASAENLNHASIVDQSTLKEMMQHR